MPDMPSTKTQCVKICQLGQVSKAQIQKRSSIEENNLVCLV